MKLFYIDYKIMTAEFIETMQNVFKNNYIIVFKPKTIVNSMDLNNPIISLDAHITYINASSMTERAFYIGKFTAIRPYDEHYVVEGTKIPSEIFDIAPVTLFKHGPAKKERTKKTGSTTTEKTISQEENAQEKSVPEDGNNNEEKTPQKRGRKRTLIQKGCD